MKKLLFYSLLMVAGFFANAQLNIQFKSNLSYNGKKLSNIGGYVDSLGNEYALVGYLDGLDIVDVTDPANPLIKFTIPGPSSNWREVKTWNGYAYVTTEGGSDGLQIVDLRNLPASAPYNQWYGDGAIAGQLSTIHALHIDDGYAYLYGTNLFNGAAIIIDLTNPTSPTYLGHTLDNGGNTNSYIHDGYVRNDTLWAGYIYGGYFGVIDVSNKANPVLLVTQNTPNNFTHNTWLSQDSKTLFTTDETTYSFLTSYDVTDISNIKELDRIQSNPGSGVIVHNTHIINVAGNDYAVTSWYRDGVVITDVGKPDNMVNVGNYDTYTQGSGPNFDGDWGVYPYLPSGNLVCSDINNGLYVLAPTYVRACYLEGLVTDSVTGSVLNNVDVEILTTSIIKKTKLTGEYKTGYSTAGTYDVKFSKAGYITKIISGVSLTSGIVTTLNVQLVSLPTISISGQVTNAANGNPVPNAFISISNSSFNFNLTSDALGNFSVNNFYPQTYDINAGEWMFKTYCATGVNLNGTGGPINIQLTPGIYDDFTFDFGWTVSGISTNSWERGVPVGTDLNGTPSNPGLDVSSDCMDLCYVTDNGGGAAGSNDVDNGNTILSSPVFDPTGLYTDPLLNYSRWFFNDGGFGNPNDSMTVKISNGTTTYTLESIQASDPQNSSWVDKTFKISSFIPVTSTMQLIIETADEQPGHIVEGALDKFHIEEGFVGIADISAGKPSIHAAPNPFRESTMIRFEVISDYENSSIFVTDITGRIISKQTLSSLKGQTQIGDHLNPGVYFVQLNSPGGQSAVIKVIKTK